MGQREVIKYLENQRSLGNDKYFTVKEVTKGVVDCCNGKGVSNDLFKLAVHGLIEWKGQGVWSHQKLFRGKKEDKPIFD